MAKQAYKGPKAGTPLISTISSGCKTPLLEIKFSNLVRPFYYPNSPTIPRYSVTCLVDPEIHKDFLTGVQTIEKNEQVDSIIKNDYEKVGGETLTTGKVTIKFQSKDTVPVFVDKGGPELEQVELEDEFHRGNAVVVEYEILRFTKKNVAGNQHGISFKPTKIIYVPTQEELTDGE